MLPVQQPVQTAVAAPLQTKCSTAAGSRTCRSKADLLQLECPCRLEVFTACILSQAQAPLGACLLEHT